MSEVALPSAFVDETSFKEFNNSFDTDDPLLNGDFDYTDSIEEITNFMNDATVKENGKEPENDKEQQPRTTSPPANFRLLTKGGDKPVNDDKDKSNPPQQQRKNKYYAPVYTVRDRVSGTTATTSTNSSPSPSPDRKPKPANTTTDTKNNTVDNKDRRSRREDGDVRHKERSRGSKREDDSRRRERDEEAARKKQEREEEAAKRKEKEEEAARRRQEKEEEARLAAIEQQRKLEEMRRAHEAEAAERERKRIEKERERADREKLQASRVAGERATLYDLMTVTFSPTTTFEAGEVVLVPRTRGGYSYGRIVQHFVVDRCYVDSNVSHSTYHWRIVYPNPGGGGNMFKDLPPAYIGKLVTFFNKDLVMPKDEENERVIGDKPLGKDLNNAVFLPANKFNPHQIVLVPRSKGGFTYGRIVKECTFPCRVDDNKQHDVPGYRVLVSGEGGEDAGPKVRKDVLAGNIGKLYIPEQMQAAMQAANEAATLPMPSTSSSSSAARRRISPEARDAFPAPPMLSGSAANPIPGMLPLPAGVSYSQALQGAQGSGSGTSSVPTSAPGSAATTPRAAVPASTSPVPPTSPVRGATIGPIVPTAVENGTEKAPEVGRVSPIPLDPLDIKAEAAEPNEQTPNKPMRGVIELPEGVLPKHPPKGERSRSRREASEHAPDAQPLVVIDGPNVAMKHGKKNNFSVRGIQLALQYYKSRGFDALAFVPEYFATRKAPQHQLGSSTLKLGDFMPVGDDLPLLQKLVDQGSVVLTPPQDYDDSYSIEYARRHNACIVTNDRYNDHIDKQTDREKGSTRKFIRDHCISFTFVRDEFLPNPDFKFPNS